MPHWRSRPPARIRRGHAGVTVQAAGRPARSYLTRIAPGLALSAGLAGTAMLLREITGLTALNPVVVALVLGIAVRAAAGAPRQLAPGVSFAVRPVLRAAIVLLGSQVTLQQLLSVGGGALLLAFASVALTMPFTMWLGTRLAMKPALAQLIGAGTGICGASAVAAANQVAGGEQEDVAYALAIVTLFGTLAMLAYPALGDLLTSARGHSGFGPVQASMRSYRPLAPPPREARKLPRSARLPS